MRRITASTTAALVTAVFATGGAAAGEWQRIFDGETLDGWTPKIRGYPAGENFADTFRVEDGAITVSYDGYETFGDRFGHLFYRVPYSHYRLRLEYRIFGEPADGIPDWAFRNSGVMYHSPAPRTMPPEQNFPICLEFQFLAGRGDGRPRPTGNLCTPGTNVVYGGEFDERHCIESSSPTIDAGEWVQAELLVLGDDKIVHYINGEPVLEFTKPTFGGAGVNGHEPRFLTDGEPATWGYISLQAEGHPIQFRNIEVRDLTDVPKHVDAAHIGNVLEGFVEHGKLVGVSALVFEDGEEAFFGAFGMADREAGRPMARDTLVQIRSMTKPITGVTLMTLYEEGRFALDEPLEKYLPEYAGIKVYAGHEDGEPVLRAPARKPTIRDVLRHTAGFGGEEDPSWVGDEFRRLDPRGYGNTLAGMSRKLASIPLLYDPGARWYYGPSVDVQARLVEVLTGRPFAEVMRERVLEPLGMSDTQYTLRPEQAERLAAVYWRHPDGRFERLPDDRALDENLRAWPMTPGGSGLASTLDDYMRFARMLVNEGELDGVRILEPETVRLMATDAMPDTVVDRSWLPNKGQVGFGIDFAVRTAAPVDRAEASGEIGEFFWDGAHNTLFWADPENDIAAVLFNIWQPWGKVDIQKAFRDAVYYRDPVASALNKAPPGPDSRGLKD